MEKLKFELWRRKLVNLSQIDRLVVVIIMPGAVHVGMLALQYLKKYRNVICVANGLASWEEEIINSSHLIRIIRTPHTLRHSDIIDELVSIFDRPFWLVDHDCYLFDVELFERQQKKLGQRAGIAIYDTRRLNDGIVVPETFLILLNPNVIRRIRKEYGVTCQAYAWEGLTDKVKAKLRLCGVTHARRPEAYKPLFDTLRVVALLAQSDGCAFIMEFGYSAECQAYPEVVHIGNTSHLIWPPHHRYFALGAYFWRKCLENSQCEAMKSEYGKRWSNIPDTQSMRRYFVASDLMRDGDLPDFLDYLDKVAAGPNVVEPVRGAMSLSQNGEVSVG